MMMVHVSDTPTLTTTVQLQIFVVQKFRETAENPMKEHFRDKNFVIATFFRDYRHAATPVQTIHVVAPPTTACGQHFAIV